MWLMTSKYRLLLMSLNKPERIQDCYCSNHMIGWGLWSAFERLPNVTLSYRDCNTIYDALPEADAMLVHSYFGNAVLEQVKAGHYAAVRHKMYIGHLPVWTF